MELITQPVVTNVESKPVETVPIPKVETKPVETKPEVKQEAEKKLSSAEIKQAIELSKQKEAEARAIPPKEPAQAPIVKEGEKPVEEQWFDKERRFKTREDYDKSVRAGQEKIRQQAEQIKAIEAELQNLKARELQKTMSPEEKQRMEAIEGWKKENKQAIDFIKDEVMRDIERESVIRDFEKSARKEMEEWKQKFDADPERSKLWPTMGELYKKEVILDQNGQPIFKGFLQNPLKYFEAVAFKERFGEIAERIKQDAVEQYKRSLKEAEEAERSNTTALPGGPKSTGEVDVSKLSVSELGKLLPRREE